MHLNRRDLLRLGLASTAFLVAPALPRPARSLADVVQPVGPDDALQMLLDGNQRFVSGQSIRPDQTAERLAEVAQGQSPPAAILSCADSRIPPEIVFDQGLGNIFITRIAGNFPTNEIIGSIEYAVAHFGTSLVMVLGHQRCGAVQDTIKALQSGAEVPGQIASIVDAIAPSVAQAQDQPGDLVDNTVRANVDTAVAKLRAAPPILTDGIASGAVKVVGAYYHLDTGVVDLLDS